MEDAAAHGRARRHAGVAADDDLAAGHRLADPPAGVSFDLDARAIVQAAAVVADTPFEADPRGGGEADPEVVPRAGVADEDPAAVREGNADLVVHLADGTIGGQDLDAVRTVRPGHAAASTTGACAPAADQVRVMAGPS